MKVVNNIPVFKVNFGDFSYLISLFSSKKRFLTRHLNNSELVEYIKKSRSRDFYIEYQGCLIDFRTYTPLNTQQDDD